MRKVRSGFFAALSLSVVGVLVGNPVKAQQIEFSSRKTDAAVEAQGQTAEINGVEVGQRQSAREPLTGRDPMARIDNRIENRLQNRLHNRIDRSYDPTANATVLYRRAEQKSRSIGQHPKAAK